MHHRSTQSAFLQPNTKRSSRAAIFGDNSDSDDGDDNNEDFVKKRSARDARQGSNHPKSPEDDAALARLMLERLYGRIQESIVIQENNMSQTTESDAADHGMDVDSDDHTTRTPEEEDGGEEGIEFRLFASQKEPTKVALVTKTPEVEVIHVERKELDEDPSSLRMRQIAEAAISPTLIIQQSREPWERQFFHHQVRHLTLKDQHIQKKKKSKKQRDWEKKVKNGEIDKETIEKTARKIKVAESYGWPTIMRKGLDRGTIDSGRPQYGEYYGAGRRGGGFSGRGGTGRGRGMDRGRGRGQGSRGRGGVRRDQSRGAFGAVRRGGSFQRP
ncbi:hypothetical protein BGW42_003092 [Actinomortierella wolfii]|nr:hypothetical protein BGW42_003092 [Actinomortierella wolfii]